MPPVRLYSTQASTGSRCSSSRRIRRRDRRFAVPDRALGSGGHTGRHQFGNAGVGVPVGCKANNALVGLDCVPVTRTPWADHSRSSPSPSGYDVTEVSTSIRLPCRGSGHCLASGEPARESRDTCGLQDGKGRAEVSLSPGLGSDPWFGVSTRACACVGC